MPVQLTYNFYLPLEHAFSSYLVFKLSSVKTNQDIWNMDKLPNNIYEDFVRNIWKELLSLQKPFFDKLIWTIY